MPQPTTDPKITIRTLINDNIDVNDDQDTPVAISISVKTIHPDIGTLDFPCVVIEKMDDGVLNRSVGYKFAYIGDIYALTLYAIELKNETNEIKGESLIFKMTKEIKRIFNDDSLVVSPTSNINIIKYLGGGEEVLASVNPTIWVGMHTLQVEYQI